MIDWSEEEVSDAMNRTRGLPVRLCGETVRAIMTRTAELLAARGGTMTAEQVRDALQACGLSQAAWTDDLRQHTAVQGAGLAAARAALEASTTLYDERCAEVATLREKVAGLEADLANKDAAYAELESDASQVREEMDVARAELARLKPSGQVAEDVKTLQMAWWADCEEDCEETCDGTTTHTDTCEVWGYEQAVSRLAALAQQGRAAQRLTCPDGHSRLKDAAQVDEGCLQCQVETLRTEVQRRDAALATHARIVGHPATPEAAPTHTNGLPPPLALRSARGARRGARISMPPPPDHAERVAERSQAFNEVSGPNVGRPDALPEGPLEVVDPAFIAGYEQGAEAMRAACVKAVRTRLEVMGALDVYEAVKNAIEGAAP
jgi:serine protease inhibitor ecotin